MGKTPTKVIQKDFCEVSLMTANISGTRIGLQQNMPKIEGHTSSPNGNAPAQQKYHASAGRS